MFYMLLAGSELCSSISMATSPIVFLLVWHYIKRKLRRHRSRGNIVGFFFRISLKFYLLEVPHYTHSMEVRLKYGSYTFYVYRCSLVRFFLLTKCLKHRQGTEEFAIHPHVETVELLDSSCLKSAVTVLSAGIFDLDFAVKTRFYMDLVWSYRSCA